MTRLRTGLLLTLVLALMLTAVPLALAQSDQPPQPPPQPPQQPPNSNVNVNVNIPWGTILLVAVMILLLFALVGFAGRNTTTTHTVEHVEEHRHDEP